MSFLQTRCEKKHNKLNITIRKCVCINTEPIFTFFSSLTNAHYESLFLFSLAYPSLSLHSPILTRLWYASLTYFHILPNKWFLVWPHIENTITHHSFRCSFCSIMKISVLRGDVVAVNICDSVCDLLSVMYCSSKLLWNVML